MADEIKVYPVFTPIGSKGDKYIVRFWDDPDGKLKASCTCRAGQYGQLCKHVLAAIDENAVVHAAFEASYGDLWAVYQQKEKKLEELKKEVKNRKAQMARLLLD